VFHGVCLTTDVKGYTTLSERLSPDMLHELLNEYHEMLRRQVTARRGLVWGRGGDSALCVWKIANGGSWLEKMLRRGVGYQRGEEKADRLNACLAALEIRDAIDRFNARHSSGTQMSTRIGLDAGEVGLGVVAGELQVVGNPVTAASRIEELNKRLSTRLLASDRVVRDLETLAVRPLGPFELPGKSDKVAIVEILGERDTVSEADRRLCERFAAGLEMFERADWSGASRQFEELVLDYPQDGPARYYQDLCTRYLSGVALSAHQPS
jgi:adenylate cyclase